MKLEHALKASIEDSLTSLKQRGQDSRTYLLDEQDPMTPGGNREILGITRERARQIKEKALERLRMRRARVSWRHTAR